MRSIARVLLGLALVYAGTGHLSFARQEFQAQVPTWVPLDADFVVLASGVVEIALGVGLLIPITAPIAGLLASAFFIAIFPGNVSQYITATDAFGLDSDEARLIRLFFQPLLVVWALWASGGWRWLISRRNPKN